MNINQDVKLRTKASHIYSLMMNRCFLPTDMGYKNYGARGIIVMEKWVSDPTSYVDWYCANYFDGAHVDRIDVNGNYCEDNCRMVTQKQNANNKRNTIYITAFGETKCLSDWLEDPRCVVPSFTIKSRLKNNWSPEDALSKPREEKLSGLLCFGERKSAYLWSKDPRCKVKYDTLLGRLKDGMSIEDAITIKNTRKIPLLLAFGEEKTQAQWVKDHRCVVKRSCLSMRLRSGWELEKALTDRISNNAGYDFDGHSVTYWSKQTDCEVSRATLSRRLKQGIPLKLAMKRNVL